jgi:hypothetical protein
VWLTGIRLSPSRPPQAHHTSRQQRCGGGSRVWVAEPVLKPCNHGVLDSQAPGRHRRRDRLRRRRNLPKRRSAAPAAASATAAEVDRSADRVSALTQVAGVLGSQWGDEGEGQARRRARPPRFDIVARCHVRRRCFGPNPCSASCFVPLLRDSRNPELMHAWVLLGNCCYSSSTELRLHSIRIVEMLYKASCTCGHIIYKYFRNFG